MLFIVVFLRLPMVNNSLTAD